MKNTFILIILLIVTVVFSSCFIGESIFTADDEKIADNTFNDIITAVKSKDDSKIVDMFSDTVKSENDLSQPALKFIEYIKGDIVSFSSASEAGVAAEYETNYGKARKEIQASFCINTTESSYYVSIKECTNNEFDARKIGVMSIYIIESSNWTEDCIYRGDGKWTPGINIAIPYEQSFY